MKKIEINQNSGKFKYLTLPHIITPMVVCHYTNSIFFLARTGGTFFIKENEKMNDLLTTMELSDRNSDNSTLRGFLKLIDPNHIYVDANQLRNFRMRAKREMIYHHDSKKRTCFTEDDLKVVFNNVVCRLDSTVNVEQAEELYRSLIKDSLGTCTNTQKVEIYLQSYILVMTISTMILKGMQVWDLQQSLYGRLEK